MAARKKAKAVKAPKMECTCCGKSELETKLPIGLLIILGALGLASALGYIKNWETFDALFPTVFSALVLVIGIKMGIDQSSCTC